MKITMIPVCAAITALIAVHPAFAEQKAKVHKEAKSGKAVRVASAAVKPSPPPAKPTDIIQASPPKHPWVGYTVAISESERHTIRAYVFDRVQASKGGKFNGVPQGLAKKVAWGNKLPPEWRRRCIRGDVLPAEVHKHCQPLPHDIVVKLPPPPPGTVLLAVDGTVFRLAYPTYEILDVFNVL